jgi:hypothetical protein
MPITLVAAQQKISKSGSGATLETDDSAAGTYVELAANRIFLRLDLGTPATNAFAPGTEPAIGLNIDLVANTFSATNGVQGALTAGQVTAAHNAIVNLLNALENFAINNGVVSGTQVPRT